MITRLYDLDLYGLCRWSTNTGESVLYVKYDLKLLNVLDAEKKILTLKSPIQFEEQGGYLQKKFNFTLQTFNFLLVCTNSIDVCPSHGNVLAAGGTDRSIKFYDRRTSKIVLTYEKVHDRKIFSFVPFDN